MSYSIYIGEAEMDVDYEYGSICTVVRKIEHPNAPYWENVEGEWGDISGKTNGRHPSYSSMSEFARATGTTNLWFDKEDGLLSQHPGIRLLTQEHLQHMQTALENWKTAHPNSVPGWGDNNDYHLAKLVWYTWWMHWALENCKVPAVYNY